MSEREYKGPTADEIFGRKSVPERRQVRKDQGLELEETIRIKIVRAIELYQSTYVSPEARRRNKGFINGDIEIGQAGMVYYIKGRRKHYVAVVPDWPEGKKVQWMRPSWDAEIIDSE